MADPLTIGAIRDGDTMRVSLTGELDAAGKSPLRTHVRSYLADPAVKTVSINLAGLTALDSTGIGALIGCLRLADDTDKTLSATGAQGHVAKVLDMTGVTGVLAGQIPRGVAGRLQS